LIDTEAGITPSATTKENAYIKLYMSLLQSVHPRRQFISKKGYVGLAPAGCIAEDIIVILLDGSTPYMVRPREESGYTLAGEMLTG
jgi:hypothetical protein